MQRANARTVTPVIHAAFEKLPPGTRQQRVKDKDTVRGLKRYVTQSRNDNEAVQPVLNRLAESRQPVIVWGAGSHTLRLLATSRLAQANLVGSSTPTPATRARASTVCPSSTPTPSAAPGQHPHLLPRVPAKHPPPDQGFLRLNNEVVTLYQLEDAVAVP